MSRKFSLKSNEKVKAFFEHPILGKRLLEISKILLAVINKSIISIFGHLDYLKIWSSINLFRLIIKEEPIFQKLLKKYFSDRIDDKTLSILSTL